MLIIMASPISAAAARPLPGRIAAKNDVKTPSRLLAGTAGAAHGRDRLRQAPGVGEGPAQQELDLAVGAAKLVGGPAGERVGDRGGGSGEGRLALGGHAGARSPSLARGAGVDPR